MSTASAFTSGRRRRPLVLLLASLTLGALGSVDAGSATSSVPSAVRPTQKLVALLRPHEARSRPTAQSTSRGVLPATTPITEGRTMLPLLRRKGEWFKVRLPGRPNGHAGWINRVATTRFITSWHVVVDRSRRRVTVYRAGRPMRVFRAIVGKPSTPTPLGEFFVEESIALPATDVGAPFALALSARSNVLQEFNGGPGQIAVHGLANIGGVLGTAVSHGCVRLANPVMRWLAARIGPGTPVTIKS